jgi:hypothetical protein
MINFHEVTIYVKNEVAVVPRNLQKYSFGRSNVAKIVKKGCYLVKYNSNYSWQTNKPKQSL